MKEERKSGFGFARVESKGQGEVIDPSAGLKRNLSMWNIIALGLNISNSWIGIAARLAVAIAGGGTVILMYRVVFIAIAMIRTALSLAELGSVYLRN